MARVLIVEDDRMNVLVLKRSLERIGGFDVLVSEDPAEVLRIARAHEADAILMDVSLNSSTLDGETVDGVAITRLLKADGEAQKVPVLLVTARAMRGDAKRLLAQSGADGYLSKPIADPRDMVARVRELLHAAHANAVTTEQEPP